MLIGQVCIRLSLTMAGQPLAGIAAMVLTRSRGLGVLTDGRPSPGCDQSQLVHGLADMLL